LDNTEIVHGPLTFRQIDPVAGSHTVVDFLTGEEWPFHGRSRLTAEQAGRIRLGPPDEVRAFWVLEHDQPVGFLRLFDLEDADDGSVQFDLRITASRRGQGFGRQAVDWLTRYLFEHFAGLHRIEAATRWDNLAMRTVLEHNHYRLEGCLRETWRRDDGTRLDTALYGRLRSDG
jgi:RimJ/RimL family protein N-acetyltransferase